MTSTDSQPDDVIIARDPAMLKVLQIARMAADYKATVLITGETGSGKDVVAHLIHRHSRRNSRPLIDVNCAALPEHLVESELFGYEKGAFSGADSTKPGFFELAHGGSLFLDEIGEIDPRVQVKLLRVLDAAPYYRLGGNHKINVDVRLIAATNRPLEEAVQSGRFRRDLYHRISEFHVAVPPLRQRQLDVVALAEHFLSELRPDMTFTSAGLESLTLLPWPGNVRELRNLVTTLCISLTHTHITADDVYCYAHPGEVTSEPGIRQATTMAEMERLMIVRALESCGGNQGLAATQLGIPRRTFCRKLNEHNITLGRRRHTLTRGSAAQPSHCRAELHVPVSVATGNGRYSAESADVSLGGIGLAALTTPLSVAQDVMVQFTLPGDSAPVALNASVAWVRPDGAAGVKFLFLPATTEAKLRSWITQNTTPDPPPPPGDATFPRSCMPHQSSVHSGAV